MTADRYVVLGLAHVRSSWLVEVSRWATVGSLPIEFVKCVSAQELRARLAGGRRFSAALLDGRLPAVDRDLLALLEAEGAATLVVEDAARSVDWSALGATTVLTAPLDRPGLLDALVTHSRPVSPVTGVLAGDLGGLTTRSWRGPLIAVTGHPGSGVSTVAAALAQALADDPRYAGEVVLADLARHATQAILHDARDVVPGIQELVEAHRSGRPSAQDVNALTFTVTERGYRLLLGLRRHRDWVTLRSEAFGAALDGLRATARVVVADVDQDLEGERETGSFDIEDRNLMTRRAVADAAVVVVVASPTTVGLAGLAHHLADLAATGLAGERTLVVLNRAPRRARRRAELTRTVAELAGATSRPDPPAGPIFLPDRRGLEDVHRDAVRFPSALTSPLGASARALLDRLEPRDDDATVGVDTVAVVPGSLGHLGDDDLTAEEA